VVTLSHHLIKKENYYLINSRQRKCACLIQNSNIYTEILISNKILWFFLRSQYSHRFVLTYLKGSPAALCATCCWTKSYKLPKSRVQRDRVETETNLAPEVKVKKIDENERAMRKREWGRRGRVKHWKKWHLIFFHLLQ
jgi:hypothetical protein